MSIPAPLRLHAAPPGVRKRVGHYRRHGLETVIVLDRTMSMHQGLTLVRETLLRVVNTLRTLLPGLRLGLVVFQDNRENPRQSVTVEPLGPEPWGMLNRIHLLEASGGKEPEERLIPPLTRAIESFAAKAGRQRTIILIGDAPVPEPERPNLESKIRAFAATGGRLHAVFTPSPLGTHRTEAAVLALHRELASLGGGRSLRLTRASTSGVAALIALILDCDDVVGVEAMLEHSRRRPPVATQVTRRKLGQGDLDWLCHRLRDRPINGDIVETAITAADPRLLHRLLAELRLRPRPAMDLVARQAALYILLRRHASRPFLTTEEVGRALFADHTLERFGLGIR